MPHPQIRAVFFDAGNTLYTERRPRPAIYLTVARAHGGRGEEEQAREAMAEAFAEIPSSVEGNFRYSTAWFETYNHHVLSTLHVSDRKRPAAHEDLVARFESAKTYRLFPEVTQVLKEFANRNVILGVVSNWSERLDLLLSRLEVRDSFAFVVTSAEVKSEKPDRAIFDRALFRAGVSAEEAVHVGDHMDRDVRGALGAGLRAVHLDRSQEAVCAIDGVRVVPDLSAFLGLIDVPAQAAHG